MNHNINEDVNLQLMVLNHERLKEIWNTIKDLLNLDPGYVTILENELNLRKNYADTVRMQDLKIRELENRLNIDK